MTTEYVEDHQNWTEPADWNDSEELEALMFDINCEIADIDTQLDFFKEDYPYWAKKARAARRYKKLNKSRINMQYDKLMKKRKEDNFIKRGQSFIDAARNILGKETYDQIWRATDAG